MSQTVEVGVLDNDHMSLERIVSVLPKLLPGLIVLWSTTSADEAIRKVLDPQWRPALLITDVELDGTTAMHVCRTIRKDDDSIPVLAMSSFSPKKYAAQLAQSGAQGFMVKGNMNQMAAALRSIAMGRTFSPLPDVSFPSPSRAYQQEQKQHETDTIDHLSDTEIQVLQYTAEGYSTDEIAKSLNISTATVRSHTRNIREKLGAKTLSHAVAIWLMRDTDISQGADA
ncbi:response regulator transcription factor [Bifidobacterium bombi]|uniref:Two component transcriptional regulator, LuxR family n=2 Tax=Bifidobacterium bombi TaxID=471511 RepID=A0A086BNW0_9BIFI|nr:response regulator transcription factor [Bifidobacterium bombi]KFF30624.1 two component transcriptional regulator, LuxR family [Bifidobacterium bombi DSM 19703]